MNLNANKRIPSLDGLRTISVFLVITSHFLYTIGYEDYLNLGSLGVRVFFVISGFLITGLLFRELEKTAKLNLPKFYFRRTLRIFPPYYFYLLCFLLASSIHLIETSRTYVIPALTYTSNYIFPVDWNLVHTWSLSVEEQFYLIFPVTLFLLGRRKIVWLLTSIVVICPFLRLIDFHLFGESKAVWIYNGFHANADGLALGCLFAVFYDKLVDSVSYQKMLRSPLIFVVPIILLVVNSLINSPLIYLGMIFTISNFLIVLCIDWSIKNHESTIFGRFLNSAPMRQIGIMSYSMYLWQQPFLNQDFPFWYSKFPQNFIFIAIFSSISYFFVEKLSLKLRQTWETRFFSNNR